MADTPQVVYTDHDGNTTNIFTKDVDIEYVFDGLTITRQPGMIGITTDPIQTYRVITCSQIMTGTALNTFNTQVMDTSKTYDGTDPKITVLYDGTNSWTIYVAAVSIKASIVTDNEWSVSFKFMERSS